MRPGRRQTKGAIQAEAVVIPFAERLSCTIAEACEVTGLGRTKLYELIGAGCLATTTVGRPIGACALTEDPARGKKLAGHARIASHREDRAMTITLSA
jgi:excisionase family DNA binding protein